MSKPFHKSRTIRGALSEAITIIVLCLGFFGFDIDGDTTSKITNNVDDIFVAVLAIWKSINTLIIIYGRVTATESIKGPDTKPSRLPMFLLILLCVSLPVGCTATERADSVSIKGFQLLIVSDLATDNIQPGPGASVDLDTAIDTIPVSARVHTGGILSKSDVLIESATGGTVIIERGVSGNANVPVAQALEKLFQPTQHPFGNVTVQGGDAMREHVLDE